ncbi:hypothetical protein LCGC14_2884710 [marine sediment metagenome]|uniref:Uncharacterized protein n=1 Tax=marine sediment metagenome TaxID=412755 RepID=A0A0F8XZ81_9ZZZZ
MKNLIDKKKIPYFNLDIRVNITAKQNIVQSITANNTTLIGSFASILDEAEIKMPRVYSGVGKTEVGRLIPEVIAYIDSQGGKITKDLLMRKFYMDADQFTMEGVIKTLDLMGYLEIDLGRSPNVLTYVGPSVFGG